MVVFVAGPFSGSQADIKWNVERAVRAGTELMRRGHVPVIPHLSYYHDLMAQCEGIRFDYADWLRCTLALVPRCDALLYLASSPGADRELAAAEAAGLRIYLSLDSVPDVPPEERGGASR